MLFRHKEALGLASLLFIICNLTNAQSNSRSYNTDDWIPVARPTSQQNVENQDGVQKRPTGRVLNLPTTDDKRYLPEPTQNAYRIPLNQQHSKEGRREHHQTLQNQRLIPQQSNKYQQQSQAEYLPQPQAQQQILLPPQLQSIISQGPSYLTPQRINTQLLQDTNSYQPSIQTIPTQGFPLNTTDFNSGDIVQNINLGLYNQQQSVRPPPRKQIQHDDNTEPEVQLLYVPLENLQRQRGQRQQIAFPTEQAVLPTQVYKQQPQPQQYHPSIHKQIESEPQQYHPSIHKQHEIEPQQYRPTAHKQREPEVQHYRPVANKQHEIEAQQYRPTVHKQHEQEQQQYRPSVHKQAQLQNIQQEFVQQSLQAQKLQEQLQNVPAPQPPPQLQNSYRYVPEPVTKPSTTAAPTPKKRKPHQPPLAVYMGTEGHEEIKVGDVLSLLKDAKTISVQDTIGPESPQVFVGPSHLEPPEGFVKFDLPYLSSIEGNRVERKVDQLPFFVAPLSYKAPPGYSKIPFPAPHVGSVVINHLRATPQPQVFTTEHTHYVPTQTIHESNSNLEEVSTHRTRTRQRQPTRGSYAASTIKTTVDDIPYGPLPTKISTETQQDLNPYGPTQFVQSTTPATYGQSSLPEQIFSTKNRFSTATSATYNNQNTPTRQSQYLPHSTEPTLSSSTLSATLSNDKYTVLEEFSIAKKPEYESQQKVPARQQIRFRPTQNTYNDDSGERTAYPSIPNIQNINDEIQGSSRPSYSQKQTQYTSSQPTKHRIVDNYNIQAEQPTPQSSPAYERVKEPQRYVPEYYEQQTIEKSPSRQNVQYTSQDMNTHRTRGKQHFTPDDYYQDEYKHQNVNPQPTQAAASVTKTPVVEYKIPEIQTQHLSEIHNSSPLPNNYYNVQQDEEIIHQKPEYTLPAQLPPISPQLPGLINSLQDQQRPLLAPLLIPPSEQTLIVSSEEPLEYYSSPEPPTTTTATTTTTTTTTTTPAPIIETTTQFRRTRTRHRGTRPTTSSDYVNTTPSSRRTPNTYRSRRPSYNTNTHPRQEYTRTRERENYPSSTVQPETESASRATLTRNRHVSRERQYVSSTTEQPRRSPTPTVSTRQRFRTRGRPVKNDEDYIERSTPDTDYQQPALESDFQGAIPVLQQQVQLTIPSEDDHHHHQDSAVQKTQKEQALIYIQNRPTAQEASPTPQISSDEYINRQNYVSSTESLEPLYQSTIAASAPENNIVHDQPTLLVNPSANPQQIKYNPTEIPHKDYNLNRESSHFKYREEEPEIKEPSTTEFTRTRTRIRTKTRGRTNPVTTSRYQAQHSSTTPSANHRSSSENSKEEDEEFYGFFRPPNFQKPVQVEYKPEIRSTPRPSPTVEYIRQPTEIPQRVYISSENSPIYSTPKSYSPVTHINDNYANPNNPTQYISSTLSPSSISSEDSVVDIQTITRRPIITNANRRRPNTPVRPDNSASAERYYTRPTKRPESNSPATTRVRGRVRRPTARPSVSTENSYSHSPKTNELDNHSEEYIEPVKTRGRLINRGKSHFQGARSEKHTSTDELENENYPAAFLQGQNLQQVRNHNYGNAPSASTVKPVVSSEAAITPRPSFQLTIEPEDSEEVYDDQIPNYSVNKPKIASKDLEDGGEESKFSAKVVEKPSNFNYIVSNEKNSYDRIKDLNTENSESSSVTTTISSSTENIESQNEELQQITTVPNIVDITTQAEIITTTDLPTTTEELTTDKPKSRRRGIWKLKTVRPITEEFESAESQNVGTVFSNQFETNEKPLRRYKVVHRLRTSTEPMNFETTTPVAIPETTTIVVNPDDKTLPNVQTTESSILAPLFEMFGFNSDENNEQQQQQHEETEVTTTEAPNIYNTLVDEVETTTFNNNNITTVPVSDDTTEASSSITPRIIGTSTTTEISHETEICYRGRCVKSTSTENIEKL